MSFRFHRGLPNISIFHSRISPPSVQALKLLQAAQTGPYPPNSNPPKPLEFNLDVVEDTPPTSDQISTILSYTKKSIGSLLSAHPSSTAAGDQPATVKGLQSLVQSNPRALKWPIVVNWDDGQAAVGDLDGVKGILESLRKKRDGEESAESDVDQPKGWFS
ncbi:hypothetical protein M422DRAFT_61163 [Sphaerobolus stellatus SS14]|uniref:Uncharacterized protein n=1 Tax=Sphaerobolus stellatus (strain SS14) TaxID=990650 RepID=A0A0C9UNL2_SPHS4|nr:hypothetical protein M422DRAFT_61163 [Sphaerobolus stellatus SS14]